MSGYNFQRRNITVFFLTEKPRPISLDHVYSNIVFFYETITFRYCSKFVCFVLVQDRCEAERSDMRELGAALSGLGAAAGVGADPQLAAAAQYVPRSSAAHRALGAERARTECCVQGGGRRGPRARAGVGRRRRGRAAAGRRRVRRLHGAVRAPVARPARGARRRRRRARRAARAAPATPLRLARCAAGHSCCLAVEITISGKW